MITSFIASRSEPDEAATQKLTVGRSSQTLIFNSRPILILDH